MFRLFIVNCAFLFIRKLINFSFFFFNFFILLVNFILFAFFFSVLFSKSVICFFVFVNRSSNWFVRIVTRLIADCARFAIVEMYSWLRRHCFKSAIAFFFRFSMRAKMNWSRRSTFANSRTIFFICFRNRFENCDLLASSHRLRKQIHIEWQRFESWCWKRHFSQIFKASRTHAWRSKHVIHARFSQTMTC